MYFITTNEVGVIKARQVADGFKNGIKKDSYIQVDWEGKLYKARVLTNNDNSNIVIIMTE